MMLARLSRLFGVAEVSPPVALAHLAALKQQVPLLYVILIINSASLAIAHRGVAPLPLLVIPFVVLAALCLQRFRFWSRLNLTDLRPEQYVPLLRKTNRLTILLGPFLFIWAYSIERYDLGATNLHILFFLALTSIACIFCLLHLRSAVLIIMGTVLAPTIIVVLLHWNSDQVPVVVNLILIALVILRVLTHHRRDFLGLAEQNIALEQLGAQNLQLAATDMLTGLPNRRTFFPALDELISRSVASGSTFRLAIIDLDGFKHVNDTLGHVTGDSILASVAERLGKALPPSALLARIGGDEFAVVTTDHAPPSDDDLIQTAVGMAVAQPISCGATQVRVGASTGLAYWREGLSTTDLIERADYAMYQAKVIAGNAFVEFTDQHEHEIRLKGSLESALRQADLDAELRLVFQPIYDVDRQKTIAFEALARWCSPQLGHVPPDQFITTAEKLGFINNLTMVLLRKLLAVMKNWPEDIAISFNLSTSDITSSEAIAEIARLIRNSEINPGRINFEITETAMLDDFSRANAGASALKALGSSLALDDFGIGYSSLSHVHKLPVNKLKVDKSFTREVMTHDTARSIIASIIGLGHGLRLDCIVEGVETMDQVLLLRGLGCRMMQGYFFNRPMEADAVTPYLRKEEADRQAEAAGNQDDAPDAFLLTA